MKKFFYIFGGLIILILIVVIWKGFSKTTPTMTSSDPNRPVVEVTEKAFDLGKMSVKDVRDHEFTVTNKGKSDLLLTQFSTSCGCTTANVIQDGKTSPKFSMHINSDWQTKLEPGKSLTVKAVYDPSAMPVEGRVERTVTFASNDPNNPSVELKLTAEVSK